MNLLYIDWELPACLRAFAIDLLGVIRTVITPAIAIIVLLDSLILEQEFSFRMDLLIIRLLHSMTNQISFPIIAKAIISPAMA